MEFKRRRLNTYIDHDNFCEIVIKNKNKEAQKARDNFESQRDSYNGTNYEFYNKYLLEKHI